MADAVDPDALKLGDEVEVADALRAGDIVYFERTAPGHVVIHGVTADVLSRYTGRLFALRAGNAPGQVGFREVPREEIKQAFGDPCHQ